MSSEQIGYPSYKDGLGEKRLTVLRPQHGLERETKDESVNVASPDQ